MATMGNYDSSLQMFVQPPQAIDMSRLAFMRWLAEQGRLEHKVAGPSAGALVGQEGSQRGSERIVGGSPDNETPGPGVAANIPMTAEGAPRLNRAEMGGLGKDGVSTGGGMVEGTLYMRRSGGKELG